MTQRVFVLSRLRENGEITRNECLRNYISRLSAIIYDLREIDDFEFEGFYRPIVNGNGKVIGKDYVYKMIILANSDILYSLKGYRSINRNMSKYTKTLSEITKRSIDRFASILQ